MTTGAAQHHQGVDVSLWQGHAGMAASRWDRLVEVHHLEFAFLRASVGTSVDASYGPNRQQVDDRELIGGAYHFLLHGNATRQAQVYLDHIDANGGLEGAACGVDLEWVRNPKTRAAEATTQRAARHRQDALLAAGPDANDPTAADALAFEDEFRRLAPGKLLALYSAPGYISLLGNPDLRRFDLAWLARWPKGQTFANLPNSRPRAFDGFPTTRLWQYGSLDGLDGDVWYGNLAGLRRLAA